MNRYLIFAGKSFYARGGFNDLAGQADDIPDAKVQIAAIEKEDHGCDSMDWWQIVDTQNGEIAEKSETTPHGGYPCDAPPYNVMFMIGHLVPQSVDLGDDDD